MMQQFIEFVTRHWDLWLALVILLALLVRLEIRTQAGALRLIQPQKAVQLMNTSQAVVLDVRDEAEFQKGHITKAIHIPEKELADQVKKLQKHKKKPIIVSSSQGQVSPQVGKLLQQAGFEQLYLLKGGITAWSNASIPLVK